MRWTSPWDAVSLVDPAGTGTYDGTSCSTVLLPGAATGITHFLRMYGVGEAKVRPPAVSSTDPGPWTGEGTESFDVAGCTYTNIPGEYPSRWISFIESERIVWFKRARGWLAATDLAFEVEPDATIPETDEYLVGRTCVPGFKVGTSWMYAHREYYYSGDTGCTYSVFIYEDDFWVSYKDVCVLQIPASQGGEGSDLGRTTGTGGYLMIAARVRVLTIEIEARAGRALDPGNEQDVSDGLSSSNDLFTPGTGGGFHDIVCWFAEDPEFRTGVVGPFQLVSSVYALDRQPHARLDLGVPGACWVESGGETWLYVYYMCEPHDSNDSGSALGERRPGVCESGTAAEAYPTGEPDEINAPGESTYLSVERGVAVSRFLLRDIESEVIDIARDPARLVPESEWNAGSPVTGEALGYIGLYFVGGDVPAGSVMTWDDFFAIETATNPLAADPMPFVCGSRLSLYFAAILGEYGVVGDPASGVFSGHGIWRAVAVPDETYLTIDGAGVLLASPYGRYFVLSAEPDAARSEVLCESQLVHSTPTVTCIDPDPVGLPDDGIRVFFGVAAGTAMQVVQGRRSDACYRDYDLLSPASKAFLEVGPGGLQDRSATFAMESAPPVQVALVQIGRGP